MNLKKQLTLQQGIILRHLQAGDKLTQQDALKMGVERLGARIWELKGLGYNIDSEFVKVRKRTGGVASVKEYWLDLRVSVPVAAEEGGHVAPVVCDESETMEGDMLDEQTKARDGHAAATFEPPENQKKLWPDVDRPVNYG